MKKHIFWMIIGCGLPILLIFFAPALGLDSSTSMFIFILAMFACHLLMPLHHHGGHKQDQEKDEKQDSKIFKIKNHEQHN